MNGGNQNHLGVDSGGTGGIDIGNNQQNNASMPSPNPQTPSSIPDILISSMVLFYSNVSIMIIYDIKLFWLKIHDVIILTGDNYRMWRWFWVRPNTAETDCYGRVWQWFDVFGRIKSWSGETGWQYDKVMLITLEDLVQNVL